MNTPPMKENQIRKLIQNYLRWRGWFVYHNFGTLGSYPGASDLVAVKDGRTVWVEVKTAKGRQSEHQVKFQADIEAAGGEYLLARSIECLQEAGM